MLTDAELYARARDLVKYELALFGEAAERSELLVFPGVVACVNPDAPDRSLFNGAAADSTAELLDAYPELEARYASAGVRAFMVWSDPGDSTLSRALGERGHVLDARPETMAQEISHLSLLPAGDLDWYETRDVRVVAELNDHAYGYTGHAFGAALLASPTRRACRRRESLLWAHLRVGARRLWDSGRRDRVRCARTGSRLETALGGDRGRSRARCAHVLAASDQERARRLGAPRLSRARADRDVGAARARTDCVTRRETSTHAGARHVLEMSHVRARIGCKIRDGSEL